MRALLVLVAMTTTTAAAAPDLALSATGQGSTLVLSFENKSTHAIHMPIRVRAGETMWDWLTVTLTKDKTAHTFHLIHSREKSVMEYVDIAPGATIRESIDLASWAFSDDAPLAPGTYTVDATWDMTEPSKAKLTATTTLTIPAPVEGNCTGTGTTDLALFARQVPSTTQIEIGLHNTGTAKLCVASRVRAGDDHDDWLTVEVDGKTIHFDDTRTKAIRVNAELAPGATAYLRLDLVAWAARKRNNAVALPHKALWATATYDATGETDVWRGRLAAGFPLVLP